MPITYPARREDRAGVHEFPPDAAFARHRAFSYFTIVIQRSHTEKRLLARLKDARPADSILARCEDRARCMHLYREILLRAAPVIDRDVLTLETRLEQALQQVPLPERALVHFHRFLDASLSPARMLGHVLRAPRLLTEFLSLISSSLWIADAMVRDARLFRWLLATDILDHAPTSAEIQAGARSALQRFDRPELRMNALRRYQRRQLLRIASADILQRKPLTIVVRELSDLADAILSCTLDEALDLVGRRRGRPVAARLAVVALGKLGGRELNYSSDIDIMFVYEAVTGSMILRPSKTAPEANVGMKEQDEMGLPHPLSVLVSQGNIPEENFPTGYEWEVGNSQAGGSDNTEVNEDPDMCIGEGNSGDVTLHDDAVAVVKEMLRLLGGSSSEGMLYRTDLRLRPDGAAGAPAMSLDATVTYYERRGATWERQMLLRSRVCVGDRVLGETLLRRLEPFIYPRGTKRLPSELLAGIRRRLAERWNDGHNVKHMRGGIRHIEFSIQAIQLLYAQQLSLRTPSTLEAIAACATAELLQPEEEALLRDAYVFLRRVEHAVQLEGFEQTHSLPEDDTGMLRVSRTLGFQNQVMFDRRLRRTRNSVERICDNILGGDVGSTAREEARRSDGIGIDDPRYRVLIHNLLDGRDGSRRTGSDRRRMEGLLPQLLSDASATPLPEDALAGIEQFMFVAAPAGALAYIEHPRSRGLLLQLAACTPVALRRLERDPLLLELVFSGWDEDQLDDARLHDVTFVSALVSLLLGDSDIDAFCRAMSAVADTILRRTLSRLHDFSYPFAVLALGKYGSEELIPGSDLDIIFLYDADADTDVERAQKLGRALIHRMRGERMPALYECDTRLRPEGRSAPLAISFTAWRRYFAERASLWERQSLLRSRVVAGDSVLMARVSDFIRAQRETGELTADDIAGIRTMRMRMQTQAVTQRAGRIDIKRDPGGLVDAEFAAQVLQLHEPTLPAGGTSAVLMPARAIYPMLADAVTRLHQHQHRLRLLQLFLRLLLDTPLNQLPDEEGRLRRLTAAMGCRDYEEWVRDLTSGMHQARRDFDSVLQTISSGYPSHRAESSP
jgi:glutamine synthetase adenylyltransferase